MSHIDEIKIRLSIEELVGSYVQLKKAGRNFKGLCPFHGEKTPSFMVSPEKGIAYCFGCHQGGDIFKFIQLVEKVDFQEAVRLLAQKTGVKLPNQLPKAFNARLKVVEINQVAGQFYQSRLRAYSEGLQYFSDRGVTNESIEQFQLGYAPDSFNELKDYLIGKGFEVKDLLLAAVLNQRSLADQNTYDRFRHRLMFPLWDHQGNVVGFSGRIVGNPEKAAKYVNSPDTPAYNKSFTLYGLHLAKEEIKKKDQVIFVEGYLDVISAHQLGTKNVVATCGTAITPQQLKLVSRYTKNMAFAFDQDSAGLEATFRAIELAQMAKLNIKIISIPSGKDPDECIKNNPNDWLSATQNPLEVMDFYFNYVQSKFDANTMDGKREIMNFLLPIIKLYKSEVERGIYLNRLAVLLKVDVRLLWKDLANTVTSSKGSQMANPFNQKEPSSSTPKKVSFSREAYLLGIILNLPSVYPRVQDKLKFDFMQLDEGLEKFYNALKKVYTLESCVSLEELNKELNEDERAQLSIYMLLIDEAYPDVTDALLQREADKLIDQINRVNISEAKQKIQFKIKSASTSDEKKELLHQLVKLNRL